MAHMPEESTKAIEDIRLKGIRFMCLLLRVFTRARVCVFVCAKEIQLFMITTKYLILSPNRA